MKNEKKIEIDKRFNFNHCKSLLFFFKRYFKRNWLLILNIFLTPWIYLLISIFTRQLGYMPRGIYLNFVVNAILIITLVIQSLSIAFQFMIYCINDIKQSVIFKRIGITQVKNFEFYLSYFIFAFVINILSYIAIFLIFGIILSIIRNESAFYVFANSQTIITIVITLIFSILIINISYYLSIIIFNKNWLNIVSVICNIGIELPLFIVTIIFSVKLNFLVLINTWQVWQIILLFLGLIIIPLALSYLFYYLSDKKFMWSK